MVRFLNRTSTSIFYKTPSNTKLNQFLLILTLTTFTLRRKWQESISFTTDIMKGCYLVYEAVQIVIVLHRHRCSGNESQVMSLRRNESNRYHPTLNDRKCQTNHGTGYKRKKTHTLTLLLIFPSSLLVTILRLSKSLHSSVYEITTNL